MNDKIKKIKTNLNFEQTLVLVKPDGVQRGLVGEVIRRFERKGLKLVGLKMLEVNDVLVNDHYGHLKDKPFFSSLQEFIKSSPLVAMVLEGVGSVNSVRLLTGGTRAAEADAGTIRGDFGMATTSNIVHSSDSVENAKLEVSRFFNEDELFNYDKTEYLHVYHGGAN